MGIKSKIAMNTLKGQEMLMLDDGHCLRNQALDYCFMAGAKEDPHFQATSLETLRNMVAANAGITFMPELAVLNEGTRAGVKYIPCHSQNRLVLLLSFTAQVHHYVIAMNALQVRSVNKLNQF